MKKFTSYLMIAITILSLSLISCQKNEFCNYKSVNGYICILRDAQGVALCACSKTTDNALKNVIMCPNPASSVVTFLDFRGIGTKTVTIKNRWGKKMLRQTTDSAHETIDISDFPDGTYVVTVDDGEQKINLCLFKE